MYQFEWSRVTSNPDFQGQIAQIWYKIELQLQRPTNRKSYIGLSNGTIFNDLSDP